MFVDRAPSFVFFDESPYQREGSLLYIEPPGEESLIFIDRENQAPECVALASRADMHREQQQTLDTQREERQPEQDRKRGLEPE